MSLSCSSPSEWLGVSEERKKDRGETTQSFCVVCYKYYLLYTKRLWVNKIAVHVVGTPPLIPTHRPFRQAGAAPLRQSWGQWNQPTSWEIHSFPHRKGLRKKPLHPTTSIWRGRKLQAWKSDCSKSSGVEAFNVAWLNIKDPRNKPNCNKKGDRRYVNCLFLFTSWLKLHVPASLWFHALLQTIHWPRCQENHRHHSFHVIFPQAQIRHLDLDLLSCIYRPCTNSSPRKEAGSSPTVFKKLLLLVLGNVIWMHRPPPPQPLEA